MAEKKKQTQKKQKPVKVHAVDYRQSGGLPPHPVGAISEDGKTIYIGSLGKPDSERAAYKTETVPPHVRFLLGV